MITAYCDYRKSTKKSLKKNFFLFLYLKSEVFFFFAILRKQCRIISVLPMLHAVCQTFGTTLKSHRNSSTDVIDN